MNISHAYSSRPDTSYLAHRRSRLPKGGLYTPLVDLEFGMSPQPPWTSQCYLNCNQSPRVNAAHIWPSFAEIHVCDHVVQSRDDENPKIDQTLQQQSTFAYKIQETTNVTKNETTCTYYYMQHNN